MAGAPVAAVVAAPRRDYGTLPTTQQEQRGADAQPLQEQQHDAAQQPAGGGPKQRRLVPGWAYLLLFVLLYSANNAVLANFLARGPPFTICGIMCVGNFLGCLSLYPVFHRQIVWRNIRCVVWLALSLPLP